MAIKWLRVCGALVKLLVFSAITDKNVPVPTLVTDNDDNQWRVTVSYRWWPANLDANTPVHTLPDCQELLRCSCHLSWVQCLGSQVTQSLVQGHRWESHPQSKSPAPAAESPRSVFHIGDTTGSRQIYTVSQKKGCHPNHGYNFVNSWSICKILSLLQRAVNFQQNSY